MADNLKSVYSHIEVGEDEMQAYRTRLAGKLPQKRHIPWIPISLAGTIAALALLALLLPQQNELGQENLDALARWVATNPDQAAVKADEHIDEPGLQGHNAAMVLVQTEPLEEAMVLAGNALEVEPRVDFRLFYLEFLLDHTDEFLFNPDKLEALIDR
ncbi:MAG: hypothetical protein MI867_28720, partial [Pseudomonadales bacterium]|nr:hypothetical protein [Pseudomonadales bacterium]